MEDRCLICGSIVPEGTEVCPQCSRKWLPDDDIDLDILLHTIRKKKQTEKEGDEQSVDR